MIVVFDEFPADTLIGPDGRIDAARYPNFAALARTSTWFRNGQTGLRLDLQGGAGDPRRAHAEARDRAGRAQPPAEHLPPDGPARVRRDQGRVRHGALSAADLPRRRARAGRACSSAWPAAGARPACTSGSARSATGRGRPSTSTTRCSRTSRGSTCLRGTRAGLRATTRSRGSTAPAGFHDRAAHRPQPPAPPAPGRLHRPPARADHAPHAAHRAVRPALSSSSSPTTATRSRWASRSAGR